MQHLHLQKVIKEIDTTILQRDFFSVIPYLEDYRTLGFSLHDSFQLSCTIKLENYNEMQYSFYMLSKIKNILDFKFDIEKLGNLINNLNYFFHINTENNSLNYHNGEYFYSLLDRIVNIFQKTYLELLNYGFTQEEAFDITSNLNYNILLEDNIDDLYIDFILKVFEIQIFNTLNTINSISEVFVSFNMDNINQHNLKEWFKEFIKDRNDVAFFFTNSLKSLNI